MTEEIEYTATFEVTGIFYEPDDARRYVRLAPGQKSSTELVFKDFEPRSAAVRVPWLGRPDGEYVLTLQWLSRGKSYHFDYEFEGGSHQTLF